MYGRPVKKRCGIHDFPSSTHDVEMCTAAEIVWELYGTNIAVRIVSFNV